MQRTTIVITAAVSVALVAILSVAAISAKTSGHATTEPTSTSIDVMQMMKDAGVLPDQKYDAH